MTIYSIAFFVSAFPPGQRGAAIPKWKGIQEWKGMGTADSADYQSIM